MDSIVILVFQLVVLIFSVMIHEISHGYIAEYLGDPTARLAGRLTLNPLKHLDFFGSFLLPVSLFFLSGGSFVFGWAKPVPYNPVYLKNPKSGAGKIACAGPASNFLFALAFGIFGRFLPVGISAKANIIAAVPFGNTSVIHSPLEALFYMFMLIVFINILLGIFNLVPVPPLDGSKVLFALLPSTESGLRLMSFLERYGIVLILIFIFFGFRLITPLVDFLYFAAAGHPAGF